MAHKGDFPYKDSRKGFSRRTFIKTVSAGALAVSLRQGMAHAAHRFKNSEIPPRSMIRTTLNINNKKYKLLVEARWTLLFVLREKLGIIGPKEGCGRGECGACSVLIDDLPRYACMTLALEAEGSRIETVEGLLKGEELGPVQEAFLQEDAFQCGYCTPGQVIAAEGLLRKYPHPDPETLRKAMSGNLCRCGAYIHIQRAVQMAAQRNKG